MPAQSTASRRVPWRRSMRPFIAQPLMQQSITLKAEPAVQYLLRIADTCLILSHRLSEWCGHAPALEEDIAMANIALDLLGQARALLAYAGQREDEGHDEDQLAFLRNERDYFNVTLVELPNGTSGRRDFAFTMLRTFVMAAFLTALWEELSASSDSALAAIAAKAVKESRYHRQHAGEWVVRLGDGTDESKRRLEAARERLWIYTAELFTSDAIDEAAAASGLGPKWSSLHAPWLAEVTSVFGEARMTPIDEATSSRFLTTGKTGRHSEHMGFVLAEMQHLQRSYPGGAW
jgi:ring-1,2-phenylacetyl-CoA epoxidase subunit PaaC